MFCAYQAGAYRAILERLTPDLIVGASGGALNAWAIGGHCTPERLIESWLDPTTGHVLRFLPNSGWRFDAAALALATERLATEFSPRMPVGIVLTEIPSMAPVLFRSDSITARHLLASCSIPLCLPPVSIAGRRYVDGGLFNKLPNRAAVEMGASRLIAVDALHLDGSWWMRAGMSAMRVAKPGRRSKGTRLPIKLIRPAAGLGNVNDAVVWQRDRIRRWIDCGYEDTVRALMKPWDAG
jgi:predicted acylesterase/phospholipase RssA